MGDSTRAQYAALIKPNLGRSLDDGWPVLGRHFGPLLLLVALPAVVFWLMARLFNVLVPVPPTLGSAPSLHGADAAALLAGLCGSGAFAEERMVWGAAASSSVIACVALVGFAAYSMRPYFRRGLEYWAILVGAGLATFAIAWVLQTDGRVYARIFPEFFVATVAKANCAVTAEAPTVAKFFAFFHRYFDVINLISVAMCLIVAVALVFTVTNLKKDSDIEYVRRQTQRFRTLLYLGSIVLVVGIWQMTVWSAWPAVVFEDMRARTEKEEAGAKAKAEWVEARLKELAEPPAPASPQKSGTDKQAAPEPEKTAQPPRTTLEAQLDPAAADVTRKRILEARAEARALQEKSAPAKAEWERRQAAAKRTAAGFVTYFGILYSLLLVALFVPAWAFINRVVRLKALDQAKAPGGKPPDTWLAENGLTFSFLDQLKPFLAYLAPLIAASAGTLATALIGK